MNTKTKLISGCATAVVTPFKNGYVDPYALERVIGYQIENGIKTIVVLGTTGESPTVTYEERDEIIRCAREATRGKATLVVGTGSNSTKTAVRLTQRAQELGADGVLCVTPYYNKSTQQGLAEHYLEISKSTSLPIIMYNVPSRTGLKIDNECLERVCEVENIVAIKEAGGDICEVERKISRFGDSLWFISGSDELVLPFYSIGGAGVISAVANAIPKEMSTLCALIEQSRYEEARTLTHKLSPFIKELYAEVNPIPVKCALSQLGLIENELRLPLTPSTRERQIMAELIRLRQEK
ncbi:MAG: 4-hydroxy-tetrahydrodipicolinate synthase [Clostridia bacterium]|nr:4-hydroxy-tetrahydrodipicolinate synthase [Clostridia bacterium]